MDISLHSKAGIAPALALVLPQPWAGRVAGGMPCVPLSELPQLPVELATGAVVALAGDVGERLGFGMIDRENEVLRALAGTGDEEFDLAFFRRRIRSGITLRRRLRLLGPQSACRLVHGDGEGLSGFVADWYAGHVVAYSFSEGYSAIVDRFSSALLEEISPASLIHKVRAPGEPTKGQVAFRTLHGALPPQQLIVAEGKLRYEVHLTGGLNTGLFCEMRDVRRALGRWVTRRRVLNAFAYTGSMSVVAAAAKASGVDSVDFAAGVLNWSKSNFQLNGLDPTASQFRFIRDDVFDFLKSQRRRSRMYDAIILDPPAATGVPGRRWFLETDYDRLIGHALHLLTHAGLLVVAASSMRSRPDKIENQIRTAARDHGRRMRLVQSFGLPADYPTPMIFPQGRYLKCYFLLVE